MKTELVIHWLDRECFARSYEHDGPGFATTLNGRERGSHLVRLVRDRGQWSLDVSRAGWDDWFDLDLTAFVIDSREVSVVDRLAAVTAANLEHLLPALREARRKQKEVCLGHLPSRQHDDLIVGRFAQPRNLRPSR